MSTLSSLLIALIFLPMMISLTAMPYLTRETISFGVTVSEDNYRSETLHRMRRSYSMYSGILYAVLFILCIIQLLRSTPVQQNGVIGAYIVMVILISAAMNVIYYFKMKKLFPSLPSTPAPSMLAVDTSFRQGKLVLSNKWFLIHVVIILAGLIAVLNRYEQIPSLIPMKFDLMGNVTRSAVKSYRSVLYPSIIQTFMTLLFIFINWSIRNSKQQIQADDPQRSRRQNIVFRRSWSLFTVLSSFALLLLFSMIQLNMLGQINVNSLMLISLLTPIFVILFAFLISFRTGQGGSRISRPAAGSKLAPVNNDSHWKLGMFYFNRQDPALFMEKRIGVGWTLNFGHPLCWLVLLGISGFIALTYVFAR